MLCALSLFSLTLSLFSLSETVLHRRLSLSLGASQSLTRILYLSLDSSSALSLRSSLDCPFLFSAAPKSSPLVRLSSSIYTGVARLGWRFRRKDSEDRGVLVPSFSLLLPSTSRISCRSDLPWERRVDACLKGFSVLLLSDYFYYLPFFFTIVIYGVGVWA